jgi:hypothetical protein
LLTLVIWDKKLVTGFCIVDRWLILPDSAEAEPFYASWVNMFLTEEKYRTGGTEPVVYWITWLEDTADEKRSSNMMISEKVMLVEVGIILALEGVVVTGRVLVPSVLMDLATTLLLLADSFVCVLHT